MHLTADGDIGRRIANAGQAILRIAEHVNADEAARHRVRERTVIQDQHHGDSPEAVDTGPIFW